MKNTLWRTIKGTFGHKTDRDFEREVLSVLSLRWSDLIQATSLKHFDRRGIDLLSWSDVGPFPCVIQCKGYSEWELTNEHVKQARKSIAAFAASGYRCETYVFLYNRERRSLSYHDAVERAVRELCEAGVCANAEVWDLDRLMREHQADILRIVEDGLRDNTRRMLEHQSRLFDTGGAIVNTVPLSQKRLELRRGEPARIEAEREVEDRCVVDLLVEPGERRWSILVGEFGSGKSTAALHAGLRHAGAASGERRILYAEARLFDPQSVHSGLHGLLREILRSASLDIECVPEATGLSGDEVVRRAAPLLKEAMARHDAPYVVVIDGLDENRAFSTVRGLVTLNNSLVELGCPVVLITRIEHFMATFESFDLALKDLSVKFGSRRDASLFQLHRWSIHHTLGLVDNALTDRALEAGVAANLREFRHLIARGDAARFYGDLPTHPLILRFILDDIAAGGVRPSMRSELIERWVRRKIERELREKGRDADFAVPADGGSLVDALMDLMEAVAVAMTIETGGAVMPLDALPVEELVGRLGGRIGVVRGDVLALLLGTVLTAVELRGGGRFKVAFAFIIVRDFFLARHLHRTGGDATDYPAEVSKLLDEMATLPAQDDPILL